MPTTSNASTSANSTFDLSWPSRLHAAASCGHRLVYGVALALLITLYFFLAIPTGYEVQPIFIALQPLLLACLVIGWRATGHPIRASGLAAILLLLLLTVFFADIVARLPDARGRVLEFSRDFPDATWHALLSRTGPDGPFFVIATVSVLILTAAAVGIASAITLRFLRLDGTGRTLARLGADVRAEIFKSGDAPGLLKLVDGSRRKGWFAAATAALVLFTPLLLAGRERTIPGAEGLAGLLPDAVARIVTFLNDRAWAVLLALIVATLLWRFARWNLIPEAKFVLEVDKRPPVLLLRSFKDDHTAVVPVDLWRRLLHPVLWPIRAMLGAVCAKGLAIALRSITRRRLEEVAADSLREVGPFIAIGERGEGAPELGAFRAVLPDDDWQGPARQWMRDARVIVVVMGTTPSVQWELRTIVEEGVLEKVIMLMPPADRAAHVVRWRLASDCLADTPWHAAMRAVDPVRIVAACFVGNGRLSTLTGSGRCERDYDLAVRIGTGLVIGRGKDDYSARKA